MSEELNRFFKSISFNDDAFNEALLDRVGITVNKNAIPFDTQKPNITSGIRIGTPAMTTRGMKEDEMKEIARLIDMALSGEDEEKVGKEVLKLTSRFPLY